MLYMNLSVSSLYASIPTTKTIESFFLLGLELDNDRLAVSAMEELIRRDDTEMIIIGLRQAFERGTVQAKTTMATMIGRSLSESYRGINPFLSRLGEYLLEADGPNPFRDYLEGEGKRLAFKSDDVVLQSVSLSDLPEDALRRFGKYLNLDGQKA